jgi:hypothetical protein
MCLGDTEPEGGLAISRLAYRGLYTVNPVEARKLLIETYEETGSLSDTARRWETSRHVVSKWVRRYEAEVGPRPVAASSSQSPADTVGDRAASDGGVGRDPL